MTTKEQHKQVADYIKAHPELVYWQVAINLGISTGTVSRVAKEFGLGRSRKLNINQAMLTK
jgi:DNA-binding MurR/RpiR family transcriptional regulator